jgi:sugar phosphate isomerase/epimerase
VSPTVLASTGVITQAPDHTDHKMILEHAPAFGAAGLELVVHEQWYGHLDEVVEDLRSSDLSFPVVHADKTIGRGLGSEDADEGEDALERLERNCRAATAVGARTLVLHLWERPSSDEQLERNLDRLPACLDMAEAYKLVLAVETIPGTAGTPLANIQLAVERDRRCRVTLDTEFLGFHGQVAESIATDWLWDHNLVCHVHLKDFDGRMRDAEGPRYLFPGEGRLDLQGFLAGLVQRGYDGAFTFEGSARSRSGELETARIEQAAAIMRELADS